MIPGGTSSGSCASGFGVCCILTSSCGATISTNNTYFSSSSATSGPEIETGFSVFLKLNQNQTRINLEPYQDHIFCLLPLINDTSTDKFQCNRGQWTNLLIRPDIPVHWEMLGFFCHPVVKLSKSYLGVTRRVTKMTCPCKLLQSSENWSSSRKHAFMFFL